MVGIPTTTPYNLAIISLSLPTILYMQYQSPISSYSKAPWGLSVLLRVMGIFTHNTTSPGLPSRQRSNHYAIRAGRNLPDKEFRYLRTVIVTAAVHWGFNSELSPLLLTFQHWAGVSPYTSPSSLAQTCVFVKQLLEPLRCGLLLLPSLVSSHNAGTPSPEVTGPFCRVPQRQLACPPQISHPVHLCRFPVRALNTQSHRGFSRQCRICDSTYAFFRISCLNIRIFLYIHTASLHVLFRQYTHIPSCVPSFHSYQVAQQYQTAFHSHTLLSLCLGPDSPREDKPSPGNLGLPVRGFLTLFLATHSCILTPDTSTILHNTASTAYRTLSYQVFLLPRLRQMSQPRYIVGAETLDQ
eukprot:TRINITY_DN330_c0_g2_i1.p2 TRINITY_DN330_c0_g2~~TRINITY_DN330_c0_g2_i1.p2  ORF type:complete len:354 (+),score=-57.41 TRINITY_DN330_c0_g2_i1:264-1325(+)